MDMMNFICEKTRELNQHSVLATCSFPGTIQSVLLVILSAQCMLQFCRGTEDHIGCTIQLLENLSFQVGFFNLFLALIVFNINCFDYKSGSCLLRFQKPEGWIYKVYRN